MKIVKTSAPLRRSQSDRREGSRRLLIEAMLEIVEEDGVSAATFEAIGRRAGCSRGLATQRFGSKEGLTRAAIDYFHAERDKDLTRIEVESFSGFKGLLTYVQTHFDAYAQTKAGRAYFSLLAHAVADLSDMRSLFAESHERAERQLARYIKNGQLDGSVRKDIDPQSGALMIGSLLMGASIQAIVDQKIDLAKVRDATLKTLGLSFAAI